MTAGPLRPLLLLLHCAELAAPEPSSSAANAVPAGPSSSAVDAAVTSPSSSGTAPAPSFSSDVKLPRRRLRKCYSRCLCRSAAPAAGAGAAHAGLPAPRRTPPVTVEGSPGRGWICSSGRGPRHQRMRMKRIRVCAACGGAQLGGGFGWRRGGGAGGGREAGSGGEARRESGKDNGW
jgi:hypothetical protein